MRLDGARTVQVAGHHDPVDDQAHCHDERQDWEHQDGGHGTHCLTGYLDAGHRNLHAQMAAFTSARAIMGSTVSYLSSEWATAWAISSQAQREVGLHQNGGNGAVCAVATCILTIWHKVWQDLFRQRQTQSATALDG